MKKLLIWAMVLTSIICVSCTKSEEGAEDKLGSIYGIVTELGTTEPMKTVGVELYKAGNLLMKTVTFDDGHFEFKDLNPGNYQVKVVADEYKQTDQGHVTVEKGRQARIDLQVRTTVARIYGVVTYAGTDTPVAEAEIVLEHDNYDIEDGPCPYIYARVYSDKNGHYNIDHIETTVSYEHFSGEVVFKEEVIYYIRAHKGNYSFYSGEVGYPQAHKMVLKAGDRLQVNLQLSQDE